MTNRRLRQELVRNSLTMLLGILALALIVLGSVIEPKSVSVAPKSKGTVIRNWGLLSVKNADVHAAGAWNYSLGSPRVVVAVIDTGIDANHPDLKDNLWHKPGTDEYGWDFTTNTKNPVDQDGHGTHVAGIIAASNAAEAGAIGIAPYVKIMALKYYIANDSASANINRTAQAIHYAIDNGANIINYSSSGLGSTEAEARALKRAEAAGILVVVAAGNEGVLVDKENTFPASFTTVFSNLIAVASMNSDSQIIESSNYGFQTVQLAAPGENIFSTLPNGRYGFLTGTSQAAPFVAGTAALLLSKYPALKPNDLVSILCLTASRLPSTEGKVSAGRLNAEQAMFMGAAYAPSPENDEILRRALSSDLIPVQF